MNNFFYKTIAVILFSISFVACSNKTKNQISGDFLQNQIITTHKWYYINANGFENVSSPDKAPKVIKKPYTESLRISGIGQTAEIDNLQGNAPKAYAIVNHLGILEFDQENVIVHTDKFIFQDFTTDGIVFLNGNPVFSLYKDSFFNNSLSSNYSSHPDLQNTSVLVQFDTKANAFFPIINTTSLNLNSSSQVTDYFWNGNYWYYCIKDSKENKTEFSYIKWKPNAALLSILPNDSKIDEETKIDKNTKLEVQSSTEEEFRRVKEIKNFSNAPERVKKLLTYLPKDFPFLISVKTAGGPSPRIFENQIEELQEAQGVVQISDTWVSAIFEDGTMYFSGALFGKRILNNSKPIALRLPKLPTNFVYTDFGISGNTLYVAWEESIFYETGRCGFLSVDLSKVLYNE